MSGWQKIETAPKDGTIILIWDATDAARQYGSEGGGPFLAEFDPSLAGDWRICLDGQHTSATHWMLLPEPPTP